MVCKLRTWENSHQTDCRHFYKQLVDRIWMDNHAYKGTTTPHDLMAISTVLWSRRSPFKSHSACTASVEVTGVEHENFKITRDNFTKYCNKPAVGMNVAWVFSPQRYELRYVCNLRNQLKHACLRRYVFTRRGNFERPLSFRLVR